MIVVEYLQGAELAFHLDDNTKVSQVGGVFKARRTDKSMAALIPGLKVKVEGTYTESRQTIATSVKFTGDDLEQAQLAEASVNQKLSEDRANGVTNILLQKGHVPLTRILAPGAMGEAHQIGTDKSAEALAENRRVVVRVLQNKAIAGV